MKLTAHPFDKAKLKPDRLIHNRTTLTGLAYIHRSKTKNRKPLPVARKNQRVTSACTMAQTRYEYALAAQMIKKADTKIFHVG